MSLALMTEPNPLAPKLTKVRKALRRILRAATALEDERLGDGTVAQLNAAKASYEAATAHARKVLKDTK